MSARRPGIRGIVTLLASIAVAGGLVAPIGAGPAAAKSTVAWLCEPGVLDPCDLKNDRTDQLTDKRTPAAPVPDSAKKADCFYVYPTVTDQPSILADKKVVPTVQSIARFQAASFNDLCRVYAPVYRQMTLWGLSPSMVASWVGNRDLPNTAYGDVKQAWQKYLREDNNGRPVIFIGHSQGSMMLRKLIREEIDPKSELRKKMVGAFLMGGNVMTARGRTTGGDFRNIPICTRRAETGCVVAYSTALIGLPSLFGNSGLDALSSPMNLPTGPAFQVACTDPDRLSGDRTPAAATVPSRPYAASMIAFLMKVSTFPGDLPTSSSTWTTGRGRWNLNCEDHLGFRKLIAHSVIPQHFNELPLFDSHLVDLNLGIEKLHSIAEQQIAAYVG
ncbi:DUF3089 domain-containing protein [Gordonia sp. HY002]|uniref:DUF3089 domain-containing protein n=1 Tax=Gordonia zhenghanii TaxID=2911516 RepID=UPI001EF04799|nr:DUF3089 domain-containing protein [Gordonia zhenghanii]MCF8569401.1 DUF3089 domain-containing protein [Gordonia zhenghanii]MCF8603594.1 DUF3089 domain-containing protein [Gordonia zhenghanii]